ncbi:GntR family transcriptional regulator [Aestuariivirga sp.]|uniref:GntR family transcriptional regulator n=1 Tax=Aestuariivirga sp. TaxID=2650926 RepID=UPI00359429D0
MKTATSAAFEDDGGSLRIERVRPTLRDQVLEVIRKAILDLRFRPGDRLIERELCELTGVSRTSVREALRHLESEGLVRNLPNQGPIVAIVDTKEAREIYELREALEGLAGRLFAERASEAQMLALKGELDSLAQAFASGDVRSIIRQTMRFYDVFLEGCGNSLIASTIRSLQARMVLLRASSMSQPGRAPKSLREMQEIVAALAGRNPDAAAEACMNHVRCARDAAMAMLTSAGEGH